MRKEEKSNATVRACCAGRVVLVNASGIATILLLSAEETVLAKNPEASPPSFPDLLDPETSDRPEA